MTDLILQIMLINSAAAAGGAALVWIAARSGLRPSWLHALWLAVLLRLVMPPLWPVAVLPAAREKGPPPAAAEMASSWNVGSGQPVAAPEQRAFRFSDAKAGGMNVAAAPQKTVAAFSSGWWQQLRQDIVAWPWARITMVAWAAGAAAWWALALGRLWRFHRLLKGGEGMASPLCAAAGVPLRLIDARLSPCLWAFGGCAFIAFPRALYQTLPACERELILRHELAHYHRRDHWVRWVEFVVLGLQWWNPLAWWVAARLRAAEEAACDARVAAEAPASRRAYAAALVRTADFLGADDAWPAPRLASGAGSLAPLKRRLRAIMENTPPPRRTGWAVLLLAAASAALAVTPTSKRPVLPQEIPSEMLIQKDGQAPEADLSKSSQTVGHRNVKSLYVRAEGLAKEVTGGLAPSYWEKGGEIAYSGGLSITVNDMEIWADSGHIIVAGDGTKNFRLELKGPNLLFTHRDKKRELILTCDTLVYDSARDLVQASGQMEMAVPIWAKGESLEFSPATGKMTGKFIAGAVTEPEQKEIRLRLLSIKDRHPQEQPKSSVDSGSEQNGPEAKEMQAAYLNAYQQVIEGEKLEENKSLEQAIGLYQQALAAFEVIAKQWPAWQPGMVKGRIGIEKQRIARLLSTHGPDDGRKSAHEDEAIKGKSGKTDEARHFPSSDETKAAQQVVKDFFAANTVDDRLKYVRFGEAMRSRMEEWHRKHPLKTEELESSDLTDSLTKFLFPEGMRIIVVTMKVKRSEAYQFFAVEKGLDGPKLDWETAAGWQPMAMADFKEGETRAPQPFRVHAGKGDYYNGPFSDDTKWQCVELTYPGNAEFKTYGYVRRNSETGKKLEKLLAEQSVSVVAELSRPQGAAANQAVIERILHDGWFLKDGPLPVKE